MDIGFDTIGNAILICYDREPILVTDPWLSDHAYFGSWGQSHEIPEEQLQAIHKSKYVWLSHGHPDHLDARSLQQLKNKKILLPDHVGKRIESHLKKQGYDVYLIHDRTWFQLSDRIRIQCISDYNQDAVLLADVNGNLIFNQNDASDHGWQAYVRKLIKQYDKSFLLALSSRFGDADMINFFDEDGNRIPPRENVPVLGKRNAHKTETIGAKFFVPFSSMHNYQREDSIWANYLHTSLQDYQIGFESDTVQSLPAYIRYDCLTDAYEEIRPRELPVVVRKPEEFGDYWDETLEKTDVELATRYFQSVYQLSTFLDFINLRVGGKDNIIQISPHRYNRGITFEAPRKSLITSIKYQFFDDMLIGNFMKTTLHGNWGESRLYPDFTPYVAKYADNGMARSRDELEEYMKTYRKRAFLDFMKHQFEKTAEAVYRSHITENSPLHRVAKRAYWHYKKNLR